MEQVQKTRSRSQQDTGVEAKHYPEAEQAVEGAEDVLDAVDEALAEEEQLEYDDYWGGVHPCTC